MSSISTTLTMKYLVIAILLFGCLSFVGGCEKEQGPLEEAGEELDETVQDTKRKIEDAAD